MYIGKLSIILVEFEYNKNIKKKKKKTDLCKYY